jgi:hypothetical protein
MPLVVIQTTVNDANGKPFRITEVLDRVAATAAEAMDIAAAHISDTDPDGEYLTVRWHDKGGYWLVAWEPMRACEPLRPHMMLM